MLDILLIQVILCVILLLRNIDLNIEDDRGLASATDRGLQVRSWNKGLKINENNESLYL